MASTGPRAQQTHVTTPSSPSTRVVPSTAVLREDNPRGLKPSALCVSRHLGAVALVGSLVLPTGCSQHLPVGARDAAKQFMVGAFLGDGFATPLLLQIAEELRQRFPRIFRDHRLTQA